MIADIQAYCNALVLLHSERWLDEDITRTVLSERDMRFLKTCLLGHIHSDIKASQTHFGDAESVSMRYRMFISRLTRKLDTLIIHFAHDARLRPRNTQALDVSRKSYIANVLMRVSAPSLGVKHFYDVDTLAVLPETAWFAPQALYALALTKAAGRNHRTTSRLLERARHAVNEVNLVSSCDDFQIRIRSLHGTTPSRLAKREFVAQQAKAHLDSLSVPAMGIRSTIAASRLAVACCQVLRDQELGILWADRYKRACKRHKVWNADMRIEYHNQRILIWECMELHRNLLVEVKTILPLVKRNTATWFQLTDSRAKSFIRLGDFSKAYDALLELRRSAAYKVHSEDERSYVDLHYTYVQQLAAPAKRLPVPRVGDELKDMHGIHLLVLTLIHGLRTRHITDLEFVVESLRRVVLRGKLWRSDKALNVFSRLMQQTARMSFDIVAARNREAFRNMEAKLSTLSSDGVPTPIVPWALLWKSLIPTLLQNTKARAANH